MSDDLLGGFESFESFVDRRLTALVRVAAALAGDRHTAEDVVQEVLLRAAQRWDGISRADSPDAYVRRMVVNEYLSWRRRWARILPRREFDDALDPAPDHAVTHAEHEWLATLLDTLPARQRVALVLRFYLDLDDATAAEAMGCTPATVRSHVSRGLARLRIDADPSGLPDETPANTSRRS